MACSVLPHANIKLKGSVKTTVLFYRGYVGIHSKINIRFCWAGHRGETGGHKETCIPPLLCEGSGVSGSLVGTSKPTHIMIGAPIQGSVLYRFTVYRV